MPNEMKWKAVTFVEALDHGRNREVDRIRTEAAPLSDEEIVYFTDGTAVKMWHEDGIQYSEYTWEEGKTNFYIGEPRA